MTLQALAMPRVNLRSLTMEDIGPLSKIAKAFLINPMLNRIIPARFLKNYLSQSKSPLMQECLVRPGSWMSMELSYDKHAKAKDWIDFLALRWSAMPMALRNRRKIVSQVLAEFIQQYGADGKVQILGIGAGPSRNLLSAVLLSGHKDIAATCIDLDSAAFAYGKKIWKDADLPEGSVEFLQGDAADLAREINIRPHIVKLVGILEYLDDASLQRLLELSRDCLRDGGMLLTHSIYPEHGVDRFMRRVFGLRLRYRSTEQIVGCLEQAGFGGFEIYPEPIGVYTIITALKKNKS